MKIIITAIFLFIFTSCVTPPPVLDDYRNPMFVLEANLVDSEICFKITYSLNPTPEIQKKSNLFFHSNNTTTSLSLPLRLIESPAFAGIYDSADSMIACYEVCNKISFGTITRESTLLLNSPIGLSSQTFHSGVPVQSDLTYTPLIYMGNPTLSGMPVSVNLLPGDTAIYFYIDKTQKIQGALLVWPYPNLPSIFYFEGKLSRDFKQLVRTPTPVFE